jgi:hypothetical protein
VHPAFGIVVLVVVAALNIHTARLTRAGGADSPPTRSVADPRAVNGCRS